MSRALGPLFVCAAIALASIVAARSARSSDLTFIKLQDEMMDRIMHEYSQSTVQFNGISDYADGSKIPIDSALMFEKERENSYWYGNAEEALQEKLKRTLNTNVAKNIIFFLGDGMSISTLMAARTYMGQLQGKPGEEGSLYWEKFPYSGMSKTWCLDKQVPDSACTSTAYLRGVKSKSGTVGLNGHVIRGKCETQVEKNYVSSISAWAQKQGKGTGIVTTTRVTDASPAGTYAHLAERKWETDTDVITGGYDPKKCQDAAAQLIRNSPGKNFKVILGGGRRSFLPKQLIDEEDEPGMRSDGINLINEWNEDKSKRNSRHTYIWNRTSLLDVIGRPDDFDHVLGLFESSHCPYHLESSPVTEPTLAEMTEAAIGILEKEKNGYFLFIEGGRIDHAHHGSYATLALDETVELAKAVKRAVEMTSSNDTLIIVTSDHAHTMTVSGYPKRGNPINDVTGNIATDNLAYATITYANGPGYRLPNPDGSRYDPTTGDYEDPRYRSPSMVPLNSETHGGEDVAIFASGPWAHLFTGTMEQSSIPHFVGFASCIGTGKTNACNI